MADLTNTTFSECSYLPEVDRIYMMKSRKICDILDGHEESDEEDTVHDGAGACRIEIHASPCLDIFYEHHHVCVTFDTGATGDMARASTAKALGITITKATQSANQADGRSPLSVIGEARMQLTHGGHLLHFAELVVENLDVDILAGLGMPFMHCITLVSSLQEMRFSLLMELLSALRTTLQTPNILLTFQMLAESS